MTLLGGPHLDARHLADAHDPADLLSRRGREATSSVIRDLLDWTRRPGMASLAGGLPAAELLPVARVGEAVARVLREQGPTALQYGPTDGEVALRERVAPTPSRAADVVVTTGSQQSLDLLARVLVDPGDVVVVEGPSYLGAISAFRSAGAHLVEVPGDAEGLDPEALAAAVAGGLRPKAVYVVAEFANPTGATLTAERRRRLAELAERHRFLIVEDDPYGALRFAGAPVAPLAERTERAVRLGTASKTLAPGLRVGWALLPPWLRDPVVRAKQAVDLHTSTLDQLVVADLLADEEFTAAHLARLRSTYERRCRALVSALARLGGGRFEVTPPDGGMFAWVALHRSLGLTADELLPAALDAGVAFVP
ncbi:MAG: PLP-dependent aminotransferase family protein, partial [Acidimicrobiales bacterium]|nr:PLP-dependent aminotransferase family protein [Acidimicrobiales bacterium]